MAVIHDIGADSGRSSIAPGETTSYYIATGAVAGRTSTSAVDD